jgi:hypothetical protein
VYVYEHKYNMNIAGPTNAIFRLYPTIFSQDSFVLIPDFSAKSLTRNHAAVL